MWLIQNIQTIKIIVLLLIWIILFSCDVEDPYDIKFKIALSTDCDNLDVKTWYCVSGQELSRFRGLPDTCEIITITDLSGEEYSGVKNGFSSDKSISCIGG